MAGCDRLFKSTQALKAHVSAHHLGILAHLCDVAGCGKGFNTMAHLKRHKDGVHLGIKRKCRLLRLL